MTTRSALGRRRTIAILAAACGLPMPTRASSSTAIWTWEGDAFGAPASLRLAHPDRETARRLVSGCIAELRRLEAAFSLYRAESEISRLNRDGVLEDPSPDFVALMRIAQDWAVRTAGAFDATVQPLWRLHADHFAAAPQDRDGPPAAARIAACAAVDHRAIDIDGRRIAFTRPGMAVTLNGIAQGYVTDRIASRLRDAGIASTLIEMGEIAAVGKRADGAPWSIAIPGSDGKTAARVAIADRAVATSAGRATPFEASRRFHHLFDPHDGTCANAIASVSVVAGDATTADALSTALFVTSPSRAASLLRHACRRSAAVDVLTETIDGGFVHFATDPATDASLFTLATKGTTT